MERTGRGIGYGSYELVAEDERLSAKCRVTMGEPATCNEAEYLSLMAALDHLVSLLLNNQVAVEESDVEIYSDSMLVVEQVGGRWRVKAQHLKSLRNATQGVLACFRSSKLKWHSRKNNVARFGH